MSQLRLWDASVRCGLQTIGSMTNQGAAERCWHFCGFGLSMGLMKNSSSAFMTLACAGAVRGGIHTETVEYKQGDTTLEGFVAYDEAIPGPRPGILIVHQWMGLTDYEKHRAEMLAQLGYVAFCADIYGKGVRPQNKPEAGAQAGKYKIDRQLLRARVNAGLDALRQQPLVDPNASRPSAIVLAARR